MNSPAFRALLHRYQQGTCTPAEKQRVEEWYDRLGTGQQLALTAKERAALEATVWQRIAAYTTAALPPAAAHVPPRHRAGPVAGWRWAAVAVLALGTGAAGTYLSRDARTWATAGAAPEPAVAGMADWLAYANTSDHDARVALPDGSAITLAPASTLKYPRTFAGSRRTVYLTGAAFFDVFHDASHPFSVYTDQVVTTVLGTSFRVEAYAGQPEVQVQVSTGKVRVRPRTAETGTDAPTLLVLPNQQAVYSAVRHQLRREVVAQPALLAPQSFVFNDRPVAEVLAALAQAYGVAIDYDAAAL